MADQNLQKLFSSIDMSEDPADFEQDVDAVGVDGMVSIIETIEAGIDPRPTMEAVADGNGQNVNANKPVENNKPAETPKQADVPAQSDPKPQAEETKQPQSETPQVTEKPADETPEEPKPQETSAPDTQPEEPEPEPEEPTLFKQEYPKVAKYIEKIFKNNPEEMNKLFMLLDGEIKNNNLKPSVISKASNSAYGISNLIKDFINKFNDTDHAELHYPSASDLIRTKDSVGMIKVPRGFNEPPVKLGDHCTTNRFGFPLINFGSDTIKDMLRETDLSYLKQLAIEFVKETKSTDIANSLGSRIALGGWKRLIKRIRVLGRSKCIPVAHKPLKINEISEIATLFNGNSDEEGNQRIEVRPINTRSANIQESTEQNGTPIVEGLLDKVLNGGKKEAKDFIDQDPIEVSVPYLKQFYTVVTPSSPEGLSKYTRYMSDADISNIKSSISKDAFKAASEGGTPFKQALLQAFIKEHKGILPFYILVQRKGSAKEKIRITPKPLLNDMYFVKSVDQATGNTIGYFVNSDERENLFELG